MVGPLHHPFVKVRDTINLEFEVNSRVNGWNEEKKKPRVSDGEAGAAGPHSVKESEKQ